MRYEKYDLLADARRVHHYLTTMVDPARDHLPYWLIGANVNPAWARHCRVDDAELAASWYEALYCTRQILETDDGAEVLDGFRRHLLKSWGPKGLRYHETYPWTHTMHSSFHEMGYVLPALLRLLEAEPDHIEAKARLTEAVRGMRRLVYERKIQTFWSGDFPFEEQPIYEFPQDIYLLEGGWDPARVTGRGESAVRNGIMLHALVLAWERFGDEAALDLATGLANHLCGLSRYFNWKGEFFGHVHSSLWVAAGLIRLGRLAGESRFLDRGRDIFRYVSGLSSDFGWVPEYAQWKPMSEEHCETCCIRDMILVAFELIECGEVEHWDLINRYVRNQLTEQQIKTGEFVGVDNSLEDTDDTTFRDIDKRVIGGYSGGALPNSISLGRFRSIAGCCVGTAPQALYQVWTRVVTEADGRVLVNLPIDKDDPRARVAAGYPNEGWLEVTAGQAGDFGVRVLPFMRSGLTMTVNGERRPVWVEDGCARADGLKPGDVVRLEHDIAERTRREAVAGGEYDVTWKGCDVVRIDPEGEPLRLYQRIKGALKEVPPPPPRTDGEPGKIDARPTQQKKK